MGKMSGLKTSKRKTIPHNKIMKGATHLTCGVKVRWLLYGRGANLHQAEKAVSQSPMRHILVLQKMTVKAKAAKH